MGLITFGSLKGGVGKTSLSVNVAHAFAERGCETLLIDLDPMAHASRFFSVKASTRSSSGKTAAVEGPRVESPLARLFLTCDLDPQSSDSGADGSAVASASAASGSEQEEPPLGSCVEAAIDSSIALVQPVRPQLAMIPAGPELRHFLWGRGARTFKNLFGRLLEELRCNYDYIVIDTPPDFNVLTRNAIAVSDLVVVPVDSSAMSIHGLEEIVSSASHIKGPTWTIIRSMVNRQASRVQRLSVDRLQRNLSLRSSSELDDDDADDTDVPDISNPEVFISMIEERDRRNAERQSRPNSFGATKPSFPNNPMTESPLYLLNSVIYRSEEQNRLSFLGKTVFDARGGSALRDQFGSVARELEQMLSFRESADPTMQDEHFSQLGAALF